jgi:hypothetical protein
VVAGSARGMQGLVERGGPTSDDDNISFFLVVG